MDATRTSTAAPAAPAATSLVGEAVAALDLEGVRPRSWACRGLDIAVSLTLMVLLLPVFIIIAIAIRLDSRGPAVYRQVRVGLRQKPFTVNKFRTMWADAGHDRHRQFVTRLIRGEDPGEDEGTPGFRKIKRDPRVTRVGHYLRKSSLDELPQLWNVLRGDMSLVGPRPPIGYEVEHYPAEWFLRFSVKPGLTGLWQVSGRSELTLDEMIALDLEYARTRSFWLNVRILLRTIPAVLFARGAA